MVAYPHQQDREYKQIKSLLAFYFQSKSLLAAEPSGTTGLKEQHSMERPQPVVGWTVLETQVFKKPEEGAWRRPPWL